MTKEEYIHRLEDQLAIAITHIDHMANWISKNQAAGGPMSHNCYSFESLCKDYGDIADVLAATGRLRQIDSNWKHNK